MRFDRGAYFFRSVMVNEEWLVFAGTVIHDVHVVVAGMSTTGVFHSVLRLGIFCTVIGEGTSTIVSVQLVFVCVRNEIEDGWCILVNSPVAPQYDETHRLDAWEGGCPFRMSPPAELIKFMDQFLGVTSVALP